MKSAVFPVVAVLILLAGCATTPERVPELEDARAKVQALTQDPLVQETASRELAAARNALQRAETAFTEREPEAHVKHLSYLASRNADIGQARIQEARSRQAVGKAESERNRVLLAARSREAEVARQQAATARQEASEAQLSAAAQAEAAEAARRALAELQARPTERGMVLTLGDVLFDTNEAILKPGAMLAMDRLARFLEANADTRLIIEGHTDSTGSAAYNQELSQRRGQAVANELVSRGIASSRFEVIGRGQAFPVAGNDTAAGRQQNRRVEIVFSDQSGTFTRGAARTP
ncbi:MAG TPA: OmpA family protein [Steroidobacteraceae bacterium]|nr:OmpA family protein [Steroidobacteraceae bacterium]